MTSSLDILLLADTHLGFDDPMRPRVARRRRGPDFFRGFERALAPALEENRGGPRFDAVVHGGDLLFRSRVPPSLVHRALAPLLRVADRGTPVFLVPGNHERSRIPCPLFAEHPNLHIFDRPRTFTLERSGGVLALAGFPFARKVSGPAFRELLEQTRWRRAGGDVRLLCMHQAVEGAQVGVNDFAFRVGDDVVPGREIPAGFAAVLTGHIHRWQVLTTDLRGRRLAAPVLYPGSIERTSFAERNEDKGCLRLTVSHGPDGGRLVGWKFEPLPTRPMRVVDLDVDGLNAAALRFRLGRALARCHPEAVVRIDLTGRMPDGAERVLSAAAVRSLAPPTMNVSVIHVTPSRGRKRRPGA